MNSSFYRKVAYAVALVVLLFPMLWLGEPSTREDEGGRLAQLRTTARLGQADIGTIDPASETIRLVTLGLRGPAVSMLWSKANEFKKTEDWTNFQSTLEQLARLQPYFIKVWEYQAWNLSYNVSVELDAVRDRFYYVKQGIQYLMEGIEYNRDNPTLLDDLGWFTGNKVGRADEHELYRKMYRLDDDLNSDDEPELRDNWLASKRWYELAIEAIDVKGHPLGTKNPTTFFDSPARSQISHADAIESEGVFGTRAREAWREGARLWREYGTREMKSTEDFLIRLVDDKKWQQEVDDLKQQLNELSPGLKEKMEQQAKAGLTPEQQEALNALPPSPTSQQAEAYTQASEAINITPDKIADRIAQELPEKAAEARRLAARIHEAERRVALIDSNRDVANYEYWRIRCDLEQTPEALKAHELARDAKHQFDEANPEGAKDLYEKSFQQWAKALEQFPELPADSATGSDLMDVVEEYVKVLEQLDLRLSDEAVADKFALWNIVEANDQQRKYAEDLERYKGRKSGKPVDQPQQPPLVNPADALPQQ
ncbi:MAG: hypothetical protein IT424_12245 [Pirellulales bacterium]|nr:hypothetical protein [Pirellulales bacterium]